MRQIICASFLSLLFLGSLSLISDGHASVVPTEPKDLLALLPQVPQNWKLLSSQGHNDMLGAPGLISVAIRDYRFDPPPVRAADGTLIPTPLKTTNIKLIDSGLDGCCERAFSFIRSTVPSSPGMKRYSLAGMPVLEEDKGGGKKKIVIAIADRFELSLTLMNQDDKEAQAWIKLLDLPALTAAAERAPKQPVPKLAVSMTWVDELNPQSDHTAQMNYQP